MKQKTVTALWLLFLFIIPVLYILLNIFILPDVKYVDYIIILTPYIFYIVTFMYRVDKRFYFFIKKIELSLSGTYTSWVLSTRYENVMDYENVINNIYNDLTNINCKKIKMTHDSLSVSWQSRNILNFSIEKTNYNVYSLHFFTSTIDVPYKIKSKKIEELSKIFEIIENKLDMVDRSDKKYEIIISYNDQNPYYAFWAKSFPNEEINKFECEIIENNSKYKINKNGITYQTKSLQELFLKLEKYLTLRGD